MGSMAHHSFCSDDFMQEESKLLETVDLTQCAHNPRFELIL